jgi:succinate dehydrogenase / fumarate reductase flavoprotein subunit
VSRTFYARGQTGQQLLYGAYQAMLRQVAAGRVELLCRRDMLDLIVHDGRARGVVCRHQLTGALEVLGADAVLLATGGYSNVFYLSTNALKSNATAIWQAHRRGAWFANPCQGTSFEGVSTFAMPTRVSFTDTWDNQCSALEARAR